MTKLLFVLLSTLAPLGAGSCLNECYATLRACKKSCSKKDSTCYLACFDQYYTCTAGCPQ